MLPCPVVGASAGTRVVGTLAAPPARRQWEHAVRAAML